MTFKIDINKKHILLFDGSLYRLFSENCTCSNLLNYWYSVTLVWQLDIKFARLAPTFPIKLRSFLPKYLVGTFFSILRKKTTKSTFDDWYMHLTVITLLCEVTMNSKCKCFWVFLYSHLRIKSKTSAYIRHLL